MTKTAWGLALIVDILLFTLSPKAHRRAQRPGRLLADGLGHPLHAQPQRPPQGPQDGQHLPHQGGGGQAGRLRDLQDHVHKVGEERVTSTVPQSMFSSTGKLGR